MSPDKTLILCSTARLARSLQYTHAEKSRAQGLQRWEPLFVRTLTSWMEDMATQGMLTGDIPAEAYPTRFLSAYAEKLLWQQAIAQCLKKHEFSALFDVASLADNAQLANQLLIEWQVDDSEINHDFLTVETRQFLRWRAVFRDLCKKHNALESARILAFQADVLKCLRFGLPQNIILQGFDRVTPLLQHIIQTLRDKNVTVTLAEVKTAQARVSTTVFEDLNAECRAAVAWARDTLQADPQARLAIVSPLLQQIRRPLQDLLDDTFHPLSAIEAPRIYDFSLGEPLAQIPLICTALNLLRFACNPRANMQADASAILLDIYWSAWDEHDLRASIDATMRHTCMRSITLEKLLHLVKKSADNSALDQHLQCILQFRQDNKRRPPSAWVLAFHVLLKQLQWAETRGLSSHEFQAKRAWNKLLQSICNLDAICGNVSAYEAARLLRQLCTQQLHQPESEADSRILVLGMLEQPAHPLEGVWVIGMNDVHWPPAPRPNPLLPYDLQRKHAMPGADANAQAHFGTQVFARLSLSAKEVIFSYSKFDDERELRLSPLLAGLPSAERLVSVNSLAESLSNPLSLEALDDHLAPPVFPTENVRGGTKLLEAQAVCPAWAFYQYRLGARKLEEATDGLDQMLRGSLVHAALQQFWETHLESEVLQSDNLQHLIAVAVDATLTSHADLEDFPEALIQIERRRLNLLLQTWLALESERTPFKVVACEKADSIDLQGLQIQCRIDRIDQIQEGLLVIDYKTGSLPALSAWAADRITQPQLPFYASIVLKDAQVVGACFARVNIEECKLSGASNANIGADFKAIDKMTSRQQLSHFEGFEALLAHWESRINIIATEIKQGVAHVRFTDESNLKYCDVRPLLRLPERAWQFENLPQSEGTPDD